MFKGFRAIATKEAIQIRRDTVTLFLMLVIPMIQLLMFGYAINTTVRGIRTAVYNLDGRSKSRELIDSFIATDYFKITHKASSDKELNYLITSGKVKVGIKIPPDYSDNIVNRRKASALVLIDGSDSSIAAQAVSAATSVGLVKSVQQLMGASSPVSGLLVDVRPKMLFNPDSRSANFMVPGLVAVILQIVTTLLTALSIVRERERGTLEQLLVTPIKPFGLMLGKLVPYLILGFVEACLVLSVMHFVFNVPIHGSLILLLFLVVLFLFPALGIGLLISARAANQFQAMQLSYFIILPSVLLSGFMYPRESMPLLMNWVGYLIPATYFIDIMRGVVLRGAGLYELRGDVFALAIMGILILGFAALRFKKKVL